MIVTCPSGASAAAIEYQATNLGGSLWQYDYWVSDFIFSAGQGFAVEFIYEPIHYANLTPVSSDWDVLAFDPDTQLPDEGLYDALAVVDAPDLSQPFSVTFTWLGAPLTPGSQRFYLYELDSSLEPVPIDGEEGLTTLRTVPEPSTLVLLASGVLVVWRHRTKRTAARPV
jgi:hypothetical protein